MTGNRMNGGGGADPRQNADQRAKKGADEAEEQVGRCQGLREAKYEDVQEFHV